MSDTPRLRTAIVLFTRDLRVNDNPALELACQSADHVVPLFVLHDGLGFAVPNRARFLHQSLADLRESLRERGGDLVLRRGDPVDETLRLAREVDADGLFLARDVSAYAQRRLEKLEQGGQEQRIALRVVDSVTVVPPGAVAPGGGGHFKVFTPYWRAWTKYDWRTGVSAPDKVSLPSGVSAGHLPAAGDGDSPHLHDGGESAARKRMDHWLRTGLGAYADRHDDLPGDATSRLSADLHFGCLSPLELANRAAQAGGEGGDAYVRQLCWRDFHAQVAAAFPDLPRKDYRPRRAAGWREDAHALEAWKNGQTGYPIVDAGMRQLAAEGFMHNRARLLTASFLSKQLNIHWTEGARHFFDLLVDGDIANNAGNWQWVAGTGNDTRPNRQFNLLRQAQRFDPDGDYVRRYVPELAAVEGGAVHAPWKLNRQPSGYPAPLIEP